MADTILPYQLEGAHWLAGQERAGLHDEAGLGKTWTAIKALDLAGLTRGIIIVRAMLRHEWLMEHQRRAELPRRLVKCRTIHDFKAWRDGHFDVLLLSYERASKLAPHFATLGNIFDFAVVDEAHFVRNPGAERTQHILGKECDGCGGIVQWARHVYHLTGTPMTRSPLDIWAFLRFTRGIDLNRHEFETYFFGNGYQIFTGVNREIKSRIEEFRGLYSRFALRRTLAGVGYQLPEIHYTQMLIDGDTKAVDRFFREHPGLDERITAALEAGNLSFIDGAHLMTLRRLLAEAKAVPFAAFLAEAIKNDEYDKVVIMGFHKHALETIHSKLRAAGVQGYLVTGETREKARVEALTGFAGDSSRGILPDPDKRYFLVNSTVGGAGLNLQVACHLFLFEIEWNPGDNEQIIKRIRRLGQQNQQHARFVTLAQSYDETLISINIAKIKSIAEAQGAALVTLPSMSFAV